MWPRPGGCARVSSWCAPVEDLQDGEQVRVLENANLVAVAQVQTLTPQAVLAPVRVFGGSEPV